MGSQLWLPFFEAGLNSGYSMGQWGSLSLFYFLALLAFSGLLALGVLRNVRGLMLPWAVWTALMVVFQLAFGAWMVYGYYIYPEVVFVAVCCWIWAGFNSYALLAVRSHYRNVKRLQSPDIEYLNT